MVRAKNFFRYAFVIVCSFALIGCSSGGRSERADFRRLVENGDWEGALSFLEESKFYQEENSALLTKFERGNVLFRLGRHRESIDVFQEALDLSSELYTRSVTGQARALMANDNHDQYYGAPYELSMVHFLQSLNFLALANQETSEGRRHWLYSARAQILAWDAHLRVLHQERDGAIYKDNLTARLFAGLVHEMIGGREELQIARQLYIDALDILVKHGSAYEAYNSSFQKFIADYKKLPELSREELFENYISPTQHYLEVEDYLKRKVLQLTHELGPREVPRARSRYDIPEDRYPLLEESPNSIALIFENTIPEVQSARQYFGLNHALYDSEGAKILAAVSAAVISIFAAETLGLMPPPQNYNPVGAQLGYEVAHLMVSGIGIQFELPAVHEANSSAAGVNLEVLNDSGVEIFQGTLPLVHPLGQVSKQAIAENSWSRFTRVGLRVALKHVAAIVASYGTYRMLLREGDDSSRFMARNAAVLQYIAASRGIAASERADTRHWTSLPAGVRIVDFFAPEGKYQLKLKAPNRVVDLGPLKVEREDGKILHFKAIQL